MTTGIIINTYCILVTLSNLVMCGVRLIVTGLEGVNSGSHSYFFDHTRTWRASPDEGSAQCRDHLRDNTIMKDDTHPSLTQPFTPTRWIWKDDYGGQMIFGDLVDLKLPDICLTGEEKPWKNLTQETCPDRRSNPDPLRDRRACYHCGGQF